MRTAWRFFLWVVKRFVFSVAKLHWLYSEIVYIFVCGSPQKQRLRLWRGEFIWFVVLYARRWISMHISDMCILLWYRFRDTERISSAFDTFLYPLGFFPSFWFHFHRMAVSEFITDPMLGCLVASREAGAIRCSAKEWGFFLPDKFLEFFRQTVLKYVPTLSQFNKLQIKKISSYYGYGGLWWLIVIDDQFLLGTL